MQIRQELRRDCQRKCFEGLFKERLAFVANQSHECPDAAMAAKGELNMPETQAAAPANAPTKPKPTRKTVRPKRWASVAPRPLLPAARNGDPPQARIACIVENECVHEHAPSG
jgi:hypothetical protein